MLISALGGYFIGSNKQSQYSQPKNQYAETSPASSYTTTPTNIPIPTSDELVEWKTYANTSQKYSVRYPSDWTAESLQAGSRIHFRKVYPELGPHTDHSIYVTIQDNKNELSLEDWVTQNVVDPAASDYKKQNVDNNIIRETVTKGGKTIEAVTGAHLPAAFDSLHLYFIVDNRIIEMALWPYIGAQYETDFDKKGKEILYNMASTFQFLN